MIDWLLAIPAVLLFSCLFIAFSGFVVLAAERGERVRLSPQTVAIYIREACARVLVLLMHPFGLTSGRPRPVYASSKKTTRPPVLLLPGFGRNRSSLFFLRLFLIQRGWTWVWAVNHGNLHCSLQNNAKRVSEYVNQLKQISGSDQVDIVGYSMGGLTAAWYLHHLGGEESVRKLVTVGTPWKGTKLAVFGLGKNLSELLYGAPVLDELTPVSIPTVSIWSPDDPVVVPASSAIPDDTAKHIQVSGAGHIEMLFSARIFRAVQTALMDAPIAPN